MAFNFNWSPLAADASFYTRAQELLTTALNKSPKPPIIVDDILVNELNLGSVPPDLEILEIGDLAEDRFRGIFKMCYTGDAFLTLKTRVQVNHLNLRTIDHVADNRVGKSSQYLSIHEAIIYFAATPCCFLWPYDPAPNHTVGNQIIGFYNTRLLQAKRTYFGLSK